MSVVNKKENKMKEIFLEESKVLQMDILTAVDKFCSDNGIVYSIACGTLLGAVRHGGFIPWDDDIDIYMLRDDYEKFLRIFPEKFEDKYSSKSLRNDPKWHNAYAKIYDIRTISIDSNASINNIGINIDLFPIDDVPDDDNQWLSYRNQQLLLRKISRIRVSSLFPFKGIKVFLSLIFNRIRYSSLLNENLPLKMDAFSQVNNMKSYSRVFECACGMYCKKPFPKSLFDNITEIPFEDRRFKGFADADIYLSATYGDYMELPPISKRIRKHSAREFWIV